MTQLLSQTLFANLADERRARILDGAMGCFLAYGYQRTTMDDIARACEISRPALYLQFRNKTDIYRALAATFVEHAIGAAEAAISGQAPLKEKLSSALACVLDLASEVEASPHGADILDMKTSLATDIMADGRARMAALIAEAIGASGAARRFEARDYAEMLLDAVDGMKLRQLPQEEQARLKDVYIAALIDALADCGAPA